jgi:molybdopterin/thiamine biosynthesis adenylyltransferase
VVEILAMNASRVTVIGCGGIGGHLAPPLCHYLHAERRAAHLTLVDGDAYEARNASRMRFRRFENKAVAMARELASAFGDLLTIVPLPEYVTPANVRSVVASGDVVFLAVDNHRTRQLIDAHCATLHDVVLISGGNDGVEHGDAGTFGNVQVVRREGGRALSNTLAAFHPEIAHPADRAPGEASCGDLVAAGAPQLLFTNLAVASAMLNAFWAVGQGVPAYEEVYLDIAKNQVVPVARALLVGGCR